MQVLLLAGVKRHAALTPRGPRKKIAARP